MTFTIITTADLLLLGVFVGFLVFYFFYMNGKMMKSRELLHKQNVLLIKQNYDLLQIINKLNDEHKYKEV